MEADGGDSGQRRSKGWVTVEWPRERRLCHREERSDVAITIVCRAHISMGIASLRSQ
jgi:hypothetical protein